MIRQYLDPARMGVNCNTRHDTCVWLRLYPSFAFSNEFTKREGETGKRRVLSRVICEENLTPRFVCEEIQKCRECSAFTIFPRSIQQHLRCQESIAVFPTLHKHWEVGVIILCLPRHKHDNSLSTLLGLVESTTKRFANRRIFIPPWLEGHPNWTLLAYGFDSAMLGPGPSFHNQSPLVVAVEAAVFLR